MREQIEVLVTMCLERVIWDRIEKRSQREQQRAKYIHPKARGFSLVPVIGLRLNKDIPVIVIRPLIHKICKEEDSNTKNDGRPEKTLPVTVVDF